MGKKIDLTGQRFGKLVVIKDTGERKSKNIVWECICDCGKITKSYGIHLKSGNTKSCGCLLIGTVRDNVREGTIPSMLMSKKSKANSSGFKGVSWNKKRGKWLAQIGFKSKNIFLGYFDKKQDAINARKEAEDKYFKPILDKYAHESN